MSEPVGAAIETPNDQELKKFRGIKHLINHWARPIGPPSYYWYLTFEDCSEVRAMAKRCEGRFSFPYFDLVKPEALHMTLDRIGFVPETPRDRVDVIVRAAQEVCETMEPLRFTLGALGGTAGAVGFTAYPPDPIRRLRDELRRATLSVHSSAPLKDSSFHPHVAIAYCNSANVPATEAISVVEELNPVVSTQVVIRQVSFVRLERRAREYSWSTLTRIPLSKSIKHEGEPTP